MDKPDRVQVRDAVNILILSEKYSILIREITEIVERWATHPMYYGGDLAPLNALVEVGLESRVAFENVIKLIESKRKLIPTIKRVDYQRELMRERRARIAKALDLHERSGKKIKSPEDRKTITLQIEKRWKKAKAEYVKSKGKITWKERNAAMAEFWKGIDANLDAGLRGKRKEPV